MAPAVPTVSQDRLGYHRGPGGPPGHSTRPAKVSPLPKDRSVQLWKLALHPHQRQGQQPCSHTAPGVLAPQSSTRSTAAARGSSPGEKPGHPGHTRPTPDGRGTPLTQLLDLQASRQDLLSENSSAVLEESGCAQQETGPWPEVSGLTRGFCTYGQH